MKDKLSANFYQKIGLFMFFMMQKVIKIDFRQQDMISRDV